MRSLPPTIIVQGTADSTVSQVNASRVAEQWLAYRGAATPAADDSARVTRSTTRVTPSLTGRPLTTQRWFTARGRTVLELVTVEGLGHAWSGGAKGVAYSDP